MTKGKKERRDRGKACPQRGRRYDAATKKEVLAYARQHGADAAAKKHGMAKGTVTSWQTDRSGRADTLGKREAGGAASSAPTRAKRARHGRRYGVAEKKAILESAQANGVVAAAAEHGASRWSIYEWLRRTKGTAGAQRERALAPRSSRPKHNGRKLEADRYQLIADTWLKNQALGPRQIRNLLRRTHALRVGTSTVRRVIEEHGYVPPKIKVERKEVRRYEAVRPHQLVHLDFVQFYVHKARVYLLLIEDDYSRFILGWTLCEGERAQPVIEAFDEAVARHGRPERVAADAGSAFFSFRGRSQFERVVEDYGCDFVTVTKRGNGKLEALNANVRKELLSRVEFADLADARVQIARWVYGYNMERPHEALGGILVPADRYFGRVAEVMAQIERGEPVVVPGAASVDARALDLFRVVSRGGQPEVWLLGHCIWPKPQPVD